MLGARRVVRLSSTVCCSLTFCFCSCCLGTLLVQGWDGSLHRLGGRGVQPGRASPALPRAESWCHLSTILRPVCSVLTDIWKWGREKPFFAFLPVGRGGCHIWLLEERCLICLLNLRVSDTLRTVNFAQALFKGLQGSSVCEPPSSLSGNRHWEGTGLFSQIVL